MLEVRLGPDEVVDGVEARCQLCVRELIDLGRGFHVVPARGVDLPGERLGEAEHRRGRCDERSVAHRARCHQGLPAHLRRLIELELVEPVQRELDLEHGGFGGRTVGDVLPGAGQAAVSVVVSAEPVLDRGALCRQLDPPSDSVRRQQLDRLQQRCATPVELAERAERRGEGDAHVDLALPVGGGQESKCGLEPSRGSRGRPRGRGRAGLQQQRDRLLVALGRALLDVVSTLGGGGASAGESRGSARVRR